MSRRHFTFVVLLILLVGWVGSADAQERVPMTTFSESEIIRAVNDRSNVGDRFGWSMAMDGDTLAIGTPYEDGGIGNPVSDAGAVYIYERGQTAWSQTKIMHASDLQTNDYFAYSLDLEGDTLVVGAFYEDGGAGNPANNAGAAYVFERNAGGSNNWGQTKLLRAPDLQANDWFGHTVAVSGDTIAVGAPLEDGGTVSNLYEIGAVYLFGRNQGGSGNWGYQTTLRGSDSQAGDRFGFSVAMDGNSLVIGAREEDGGAGNPLSGAGAAYVFNRNGNNWTEQKKLVASDAETLDFYGTVVAIDGDVIVVSTLEEDGGAGSPIEQAGAAYLYERNFGGSNNWGQRKKLVAVDAAARDFFGWSLSISGDLVAISAPPEDYLFELGPGAGYDGYGAVYTFERNLGGGNNWGQRQKLHASDVARSDEFGRGLTVSSDMLIASSPGEDGGGNHIGSSNGTVYVFTLASVSPTVVGLQGQAVNHPHNPLLFAILLLCVTVLATPILNKRTTPIAL